MCIIALNVSGRITKKTLNTMWDANPDGGGIAWNEGGKLKLYHSMKRNDIIGKYTAVRKRIDTPILLHFRIATSGVVDTTMCHPFRISDNMVFAHNGIIDCLSDNWNKNRKFTGKSDTAKLCDIFKECTTDMFENAGFQAMLNLIIEGYNKLVFLDSADNWTIYGEDLGEWEKDTWYSNDGYLPYIPKAKDTYLSDRLDYNNAWKEQEPDVCDCCKKDANTHYNPYYGMYLCKECSDFWPDKTKPANGYTDIDTLPENGKTVVNP